MNDKEGRKWLLQKLYDRGFKYIYHSAGMGSYLATKQPPKFEGSRTYVSGAFERIDILSDLLPDFNEPNYLDIGKYLGIVDWSKIPVDTPILVSKDKIKWERRYFAKYENGAVFAFRGGATSWSDNTWPFDWNYAKLAGGSDEN